MEMNWIFDQESINWDELSDLYKIAPLGDKKPGGLKIAFSNSGYKCFVFDNQKLIGERKDDEYGKENLRIDQGLSRELHRRLCRPSKKSLLGTEGAHTDGHFRDGKKQLAVLHILPCGLGRS
jgi:hypothetical protein